MSPHSISCLLIAMAISGAGSAGNTRPHESHARREFIKYAGLIVGKPMVLVVPDLCVIEGTQATFAIGRCSLTDSLAAAGKLNVPDDLGEEGFVIKSLSEGGRQYVVILGRGERGTLYGVYRYFEQFCHTGFFWDGEHLPHRASLPIDGIDMVERPRWPVRQYMMDCEYTSYWWNWDQWKAEVDWAAKHRFNLLSSNFDFTATWRSVWRRFGVEVSPSSLSAPPFHPWAGWHKLDMRPPYPADYQDFQADLARRFTEYGRSIGLKMAPDFHGFLGQVPREFAEAYRGKARLLEVRWVGFDPPGTFLHPDDPLYAQVAKAYAEEFLLRFGTDHYWASQTYCEMRPGPTPKETLAIEIAAAKRNLDAIRSVDPRAVLFTNSWTFLDRSKEDATAFLQQLPDDALQIWEMPSDLERRAPMYEQFDYYAGKPWLVGYLYSYGGTTMLHGDLADLIRRAQAVAANPRANRCQGLCIEPEAIHHNPIAFDLISRLAWDPSAVDLPAFIADYAKRRYGDAACQGMVRCFGELTSSVYGAPGVTCPLYMVRLNAERFREEPFYGIGQARQFLPHLQSALDIALAEEERVAMRSLWERDLIDIARQFLSDRFNLHAARLARAFRSGDPAGFGREATAMKNVLASQEMLLSSHNDFCLTPILEKARALPCAPPDMEERIRDILTIWAGKILDYAHRDYYELVRFYYRPRVEAFLTHAEANLAARKSIVDDAVLNAEFQRIEQDFVKTPFVVGPQDRYSGGAAQAVRELLIRHRLSDAERAEIEENAIGRVELRLNTR